MNFGHQASSVSTITQLSHLTGLPQKNINCKTRTKISDWLSFFCFENYPLKELITKKPIILQFSLDSLSKETVDMTGEADVSYEGVLSLTI
jgi:hypothetical protein